MRRLVDRSRALVAMPVLLHMHRKDRQRGAKGSSGRFRADRLPTWIFIDGLSAVSAAPW